MGLEWVLAFQGISAAAAAVQAIKAALRNPELSQEKLNEIVAKSEEEANSAKSHESAARASQEIGEGMDDGMREVVEEKIREAREEWKDTIRPSPDRDVWEQATDNLQGNICAILRMIKRVNGGTLPQDWQKIWVANNCT